ncbi:MAG: CvpA family protein [Alphaproteobacteria bacterium]|nr:CvpA family protein [Alphaproteobacteria bacterium]
MDGIGGLDIAVGLVLAISGFLAFARGFVRELLAIVTWVGAAIAALYLFAKIKPYAAGVISPAWLADAITAIGVFAAAFIVLTLVSRPVVERVNGSPLKGLDRAFGLAFGVLRGAALLSIAYLMATWLFPAGDMPRWLVEAKSRTYLERGADIVRGLAPVAVLPEPRPEGAKDAAPEPDKGYKPEQRQDLDRLIKQTE